MTVIRVEINEGTHGKLRAMCSEHRNTAAGILQAALVALCQVPKAKRDRLVELYGEVKKPSTGRPRGKKC